MHTWLLPEYIEDVLPLEAAHVENLRSGLLDHFHQHGYQLVMPPLLEYRESLLTGTGHELDLKTFSVVDQFSGRLMGVRADITPQVARIDAHLLNRAGVTRLCYAGSVLHTLPSGFHTTREPYQVGAELYGHAGPESDLEIQQLMVTGLRRVGVSHLHLDLGHVGIFRALAKAAGCSAESEAALFAALQAKDVPGLKALVAGLSADYQQAFLALPTLYGGSEMLQRARAQLPAIAEIKAALDQLEWLAERLAGSVDECCFDLAELRGYHYHTGVVFALYTTGLSNALALGGRYDKVGEAFGRARPATGFSLDVRELAKVVAKSKPAGGVAAPYVDPLDHAEQSRALQNKVAALRAAGEMVVSRLPGAEMDAAECWCDRELVWLAGEWSVRALQK